MSDSRERAAGLMESIARESAAEAAPIGSVPWAWQGCSGELSESLSGFFSALDLNDPLGVADFGGRLRGAREIDLARAASILTEHMVNAGSEVCRWLAREGWIKRARLAEETPKAQGVEGGAMDHLILRMALAGNREGLSALVEVGEASLDQALARAAIEKKPSLCLFFANQMLIKGERPSPETADRVCSSMGQMFSRQIAPVESRHPLESHLREWAPLISQPARSRAWRHAVEWNRPELMAALLRSGLTLEEWRLSDQEWKKSVGKGRPRLLDAALDSNVISEDGMPNASLRALLLVEEIASARKHPAPESLAGVDFSKLLALEKLGFNLSAEDAEGRIFLHHTLMGQGRRPKAKEMARLAKTRGSLWLKAGLDGVAPVDLLRAEELAEVLPALAEFEKKEMRSGIKKAPKRIKKKSL